MEKFIRSPIATIPMIIHLCVIFMFSGISLPPTMARQPDWLMHGLAYGILSFLAWFGFRGLFKNISHLHLLILAFVFSIFFGGLMEVYQSFLPGRSASLADFISDTIGAFVPALLLWCFKGRDSGPGMGN